MVHCGERDAAPRALLIPLLIGGCLTNLYKRHTAVKIEENYTNTLGIVPDASRSVTVVVIC